MSSHPLFILAILAACIVVAEVLVRRTVLKHLGTALLVIVVTAVVANLGLIPSSASGQPIYGMLFREVAWMAIFWLLLQVNLRAILKAGGNMIALFLIGAVGTMLGVITAMSVIDGSTHFGAMHHVLGGMFTGTYIGGSANFVAIASHYDMLDGVLLAGANAVDSGMTTVWMAVTLAVPRLLYKWRGQVAGRDDRPEVITGVAEDTETVHPIDLGILLFAAALAVWGSQQLAAWSGAVLGWEVPGILILTTLALVLAQIPAVSGLRGARLLGMFGVYLFLAVIGALCDIHALLASGTTGLALLAFVTLLLLVHGGVVFGAGLLLRMDPDVAAVASQANIGGGTSALALARSLGRSDLVLPAIMVGALGTALGTYLGLWVASLLAP